MDAKLLLDAKRRGEELPAGDVRGFVAAHSAGMVPDYQMAAFLMAVCCRGMSKQETAALTKALLESGVELEWSAIAKPVADKHSTGGVGDKLSLVCLPIAASCGVAVPSLMGRGLGLTGGTVDKLESIDGFNATLGGVEFAKAVSRCGIAMSAVSPDVAPADGRLYALRDVTGTVASIPLITASILSKKLAEGAHALVFDVKCGSGAFMQTLDEARELAKSLVEGVKAAGRKATALITDMSRPLGRAVGNRNEVREALAILKCETSGSAAIAAETDLSVELASRMVALAKNTSLDNARSECRRNLANGSAYEVFAKMVESQGGKLSAMAPPPKGCVLKSPVAGTILDINALEVAKAALAAGALRRVKSDTIDPESGINLLVDVGAKVEKGGPIAEVVGRADALDVLARAFTIGSGEAGQKSLILEVVE